MTITNGDKTVKISIWEISTIVGGITGAICSICNVINKNNKKGKEQRIQKYEITLVVPCDVGDQFWIFDQREKQAVRVECTGYVISKDVSIGRDSAYIWVDSVDGREQWPIYFHEFHLRCFKTKREAEQKGKRR